MTKFWPKPPETVEELTAEVERLRQSWDAEVEGYERISETARSLSRENADLKRQRDGLLTAAREAHKSLLNMPDTNIVPRMAIKILADAIAKVERAS